MANEKAIKEPNDEDVTDISGLGNHIFLQLTDLPGGMKGWKKHVGLIIYAGCAVLAVILVVMLLSESEQRYTQEFESKAGVMQRLPNIILCPSQSLDPRQEYAVFYEWRVIKELGMTMSQISDLTRLFYESCSPGSKCQDIPMKCDGTQYEKFCRKAAELVKESRRWNFTRIDTENKPADPKSKDKIMPWHAKSLDVAVRRNGNSWNLTHLWWAIIEGNHGDIRKNLVESFGPDYFVPSINVHCYMWKGRGLDHEGRMGCRKSFKDFWLGKAYCTMIDGPLMAQTDTYFLGIRKPVSHTLMSRPNPRGPMRYWIGSLRKTKISESQLTSADRRRKDSYEVMPRVSGVAHYSSYLLKVEGAVPSCVDQTNIRGVTIDCEIPDSLRANESVGNDENIVPDNTGEWFYDVTIDSQIRLGSLWVYPGTRDLIVQAKTYTTYTLYQIVAGVFGSCLGICLVSIVETGVDYLRKVVRSKVLRPAIVRSFTFIVFFVFTGYFTYVDIKSYFDGRIGKQLERRKIERLPLPVVQLCTGKSDFGFWNVTRLYELDVSTELYLYMRSGVMLGRRASLILSLETSPSGIVTVNDWMNKSYPYHLELNMSLADARFELARLHSALWNQGKWDSSVEAARLQQAKGPKNKLFEATKYSEWMTRILNEMDTLRKKLNLPPGSPLSSFIEPLSLKFSENNFIKCSLGSRQIDNCHQYVKYMRDVFRIDPCIEVAIPNDAYALSLGYSQGLTIEIDGIAYQNHADLNGYYGSEVPRSLVLKHPNETKCDGTFLGYGELTENYGCLAGAAFEIKFLHPDGEKSAQVVVFPKEGPSGVHGFAMNIRNTFDSVIPSVNDCQEEEKSGCKFGAQDIMTVLAGVQSEILCGCMHCFNLLPPQRKAIEKIMNKTLHCCEPKEDLDCNKKLISNLEIRSDGKDYDYEIKSGRSLKTFRGLVYFPDSLRHAETLITPQLIREALALGKNENPEYMGRLIEFLNMCKKPKCSNNRFKLVSVTETETDGRYDVIKFFYDSQYQEGTSQVDRLDPAQFISVLFCTYGCTIGFSLIALLEIFLLHIVQRLSSGSSSGENGESVFRKHVMRGTSMFFTARKTKNQDPNTNDGSENSDQKIGKNTVMPLEIDGTYSRMSAQGPKSRKAFQTDYSTGFYEESTNEHNDQKRIRSDRVDSTIDHKLAGGNKVYPYDQAAFEEVLSNSGSKKSSVSKHEFGHKKLVKLGRSLSTTLGFILLVAIIAYFFVTAITTDVAMNVAQSPVLGPPSVGICLPAATNNEQSIRRVLEKAQCKVRGSDTHERCSKAFSMIVFTADDICAVWDRSRQAEILDAESSDLELKVPTNDDTVHTLSLWVDGLNETRVEAQGPSIRWSGNNNLIVSYAVTLFSDMSQGCPLRKNEECPSCDQVGTFEKNTICCLREGQLHTLQLEREDQNCYRYTFSPVVASSPVSRKEKYRTLTLKAKSNYMKESTITLKYNFISYLSLLGGFFDFFTGLNILNMSCFAALSLFSLCTSLYDVINWAIEMGHR